MFNGWHCTLLSNYKAYIDIYICVLVFLILAYVAFRSSTVTFGQLFPSLGDAGPNSGWFMSAGGYRFDVQLFLPAIQVHLNA